MTSLSSNAQKLSALQERLTVLRTEFDDESWADIDVIEVHRQMLEVEAEINLLEQDEQ